MEQQQQQNVHPEIIQNQQSQQSPIVILLLTLLFPGLGHILMGQQKKGIMLLVYSIIFCTVVVILCYVLVGLFLLPFYFIYYMFIILDAVKLAERQEKGMTIMQGESYYKIAGIGMGPFFQHAFVTGSPKDPRLA
mmetsp:Transcript_9471/g.14007  ORF Transcript_9471/g.14007 Transcript_9471/m.14007 type:complete len:135 (-) Transcript_9471:27-431(-)